MARPTTRMLRVYRAVLRLYPKPFRTRFAADMEEHFRDRLRAARDRGRGQAAATGLRLVGNAIRHGLAERRVAVRGGDTMRQTLLQDLRYALRSLRQRPGFTAVALGTLALGIGANTAIFSIVHALLLKELPYPEPGRLVRIYETNRQTDFARSVANPYNFDQWQRGTTAFTGLAAMRGVTATLTGAGSPIQLRGQSVTAEFFDVMGVQPAAGRRFSEAEAAGNEKVIVLSHAVWAERFGADTGLMGRDVMLDATPWRVVGVMPSGFAFPYDADFWQPYHLDAATRANMTSWFLSVVGRLKPDATLDQAQTQLDLISSRLEREFPQRRNDRGVRVLSLHEDLVAGVADGVKLLQGVVVFVLLIACVNIANVLLAQSSGRRRELAIRAALGAGRGRLVRQLLTESMVLALGGAGLGILIAICGVQALVAAAPPQTLPPGMPVTVSAPVLIFTAGLALATALLFGVGPALIAAKGDLIRPLRSGDRGASPRGAFTRAALVATEVALAVVLLAGAGLLVRSFMKYTGQDVGFRADGVLTATLTLPARTYPDDASRARFWGALFERLESTPGVTTAAGSTALPFANWQWMTPFAIEGRGTEARDVAGIRTVTPRYFAAIGIPVIAGREFTSRDTADAESVVVVNEAFARKFFDGANPVGRRISPSRKAPVWSTIVGVAGNTRIRFDESADPELYRPLAQAPSFMMTLALRTQGRPDGYAPAVRAAVNAVDPDIPVDDMSSWHALIGESVATERFYMQLLSLFALLAVALAACGVYGVMSFTVSQRVRELAIRLALGAQASRLNRGVILGALRTIVMGLAAGVPAALWLTRLLESRLYETSARDPLTLVCATALLIAVGVVAAWIPARRTSRVDPLQVLRSE